MLLAACQPMAITAPARGDLSGAALQSRKDGPPTRPEGACWASEVTPAVIETVTEQVMISPEQRDETGVLVRPATFRTEVLQRMVQDRETIWLQTPCPGDMGPDFIATVQRALKARGLYLLPLTGVMDAPTRAAIRRFQSLRGLDSETLTLAAAQELGIIATALDDL